MFATWIIALVSTVTLSDSFTWNRIEGVLVRSSQQARGPPPLWIVYYLLRIRELGFFVRRLKAVAAPSSHRRRMWLRGEMLKAEKG